MKYGLMLYKRTDNIGDDIQSYAAYRFLPKVDYILDREQLDKFVPDKKEKVKVIMNAWYMYNKYNFPYSPYIDPLLISMHFNYYDDLLYSEYNFLKDYVKEFITKSYNRPIGCRDMSTKEELEKQGYKAYFSGCMTLTLDIPTKKNIKKYICAVDLDKKLVKHLKKVFPDYEIKEISHDVIPDEMEKMNYEKRMKNVEKFLKVYQDATLVVTNRLHCALPCLSLKTPVLLVYYEYNDNRIKIFKDYVNNVDEEQFLKMKKDELLSIKNSDKYLEIRTSLSNSINEFIKGDYYSTNALPELSDYKEFVKRMEFKEKLFLNRVTYLNEREKEIDPLKKENYEPHNENWNLKQENWNLSQENLKLKENNEKTHKVLKNLEDNYNISIDDLEKMNNSRAFKIYKKYYDIKNKKENK